MILGALLANKRYPLIKYFCVLLIVIGVALFLYKDVSRHSLLQTLFYYCGTCSQLKLLKSCFYDSMCSLNESLNMLRTRKCRKRVFDKSSLQK